MNIYKEITIGHDPWSQNLINVIKHSPHYKTLELLDKNSDAPLENTPYYTFLKTEGTLWVGSNNLEPIIKNYEDMQKQYEKFKNLFKIAPDWKKEDNIIKIINSKKIHYFGNYPAIIGENGEIGILDGHHRAAILLFLKLPINITICERHPKWALLLEKLEEVYPNKFLYQPIPHPDFYDWTVSRNNEKEIILREILTKHKLTYIVDLGCCHGYTLYELRDIVKKAIGVEYNPIRHQIAKILLYYIGFSCTNEDIFSFMKHYADKADCIFALAVFHHFLKQHSIGEFEELLKLISQKTKYIIYELPHPKEESYMWFPADINIDRMIQQVTKFKKTENINLTNGRSLKVLKYE